MIQINQNQKRKFLIPVILLKKTDYNTKITEIKEKIPSITGSATISALNAVENKISNVINLVKKDYDTKVGETGKNLTDHTTEFNKLKLGQADLVTKTDFNKKYSSLNRKFF